MAGSVCHAVAADATGLTRQLQLHVCQIFPSQECCGIYQWPQGNSSKELPWLQVLVFLCRDSGVYTFVSSGASRIKDGPGFGLEFCMQSRVLSDYMIELVVMAAYMHSLPDHRLDVGHCLRIGRPMGEGSGLSHLLVSLPYPLGPDFEYVHADGEHIRKLWLLPIFPSEVDVLMRDGVEVLEEIFDDKEIDFLDFERTAVV